LDHDNPGWQVLDSIGIWSHEKSVMTQTPSPNRPRDFSLFNWVCIQKCWQTPKSMG
jgi:hypothetical protein